MSRSSARYESEATAGATWESRGIFRIVFAAVAAVAAAVLDSLQRVLDYSRRLSLPRWIPIARDFGVCHIRAMFVHRECVAVKRVPYTMSLKSFLKSGRSNVKCFCISYRWKEMLRLVEKLKEISLSLNYH